VSGSGNIKFVDAPRINFPPDFEAHDPKVSLSLNATATAGSKTFEYVIIPRHGGTYKIPATEFSYFDPQAKQYKTLRSDEYALAVERGDEQPGTIACGGKKVIICGEDIRYLKTDGTKLRRHGDSFFGTWSLRLWYLIPLTVFTAIVFIRRNYIRKYADPVLIKNKKANRYAAKRLRQAQMFMREGQKEQFYEELSRALWGYLGDKLNIPVSELTKDNAHAVMEQHRVDAALAGEFTDVIDECELARYAPESKPADEGALYKRAVEVIGKMQKTVQ
jgi:hypothetical protein